MSESLGQVVTIEAGHFHSPIGRMQPELVLKETANDGLMIARSIKVALTAQGIFFQQVIFADDIENKEYQLQPHMNREDQSILEHFRQAPAELIRVKESEPNIKKYWEHGFVEPAQDMVKKLKAEAIKSSYCRLSEDQKSVIFGTGRNRQRIHLVGYSAKFPDLPSCDVLDLCMYQKKLMDGGETITILPIGYKPQQEHVRKLYELLGEEARVTVIYHDDEGKVAEVNQWHLQPTPISDKIAQIVKETSFAAKPVQKHSWD